MSMDRLLDERKNLNEARKKDAEILKKSITRMWELHTMKYKKQFDDINKLITHENKKGIGKRIKRASL